MATPTHPTTTAPAPANRAERRAAARGRRTTENAPGAPAPRSSGPRIRTTPVHTRTDFAARRSG